MDLDTWVNIILAICVIIILYIARQNEQRHDRRKQAAKDAGAGGQPATSQSTEPAFSPAQEEQFCGSPGRESRGGEIKERKFSIRSIGSRDSVIPDDVQRIRKRGDREEKEKKVTYALGTKILVPVEGVHFTSHRCKVRGTNPAMSAMMKYSEEQFKTMEVFAARWTFGDFSCWAVDGIESNRILYVLKKREIPTVEITVVAPPEMTGDEYPETQGMDYQKIQLIP